MKTKEKIHKYLQEKALNKAINQLIGDIGEHYIDDKKLLFRVKDEKIELLEKLDFKLPSWNEVSTLAKKYYKNFDDTVTNNIIYEFSYLTQEKDLSVSAKDSDIILGNNHFTNLTIYDANKVKIYADTLEKGGININAKNIEFLGIHSSINKDINMTSELILFYRSYFMCFKNINIDSKFIEFKNSEIMYSDNLYLKANLIISDNSILRAAKKIEIIDPNCDEIKGVYAHTIIYNGQDISYSENIVMPKLKINFLEILYKVKNKILTNLDKELELKTKKIESELKNKPITKILKK